MDMMESIIVETGPIEIKSRESIEHALSVLEGKIGGIKMQLSDLEKVHGILLGLRDNFDLLDTEGYKANVKIMD